MTTQEIERMFSEQIPPSHPDTERYFRDECIVNRLLIYDGRKNKAVCTSCGCEWDTYPGEYSRMHGLKDTCPECGETLICVSVGKGRAKYEELHRLMTFASDGKNLWIVQNDIFVHFLYRLKGPVAELHDPFVTKMNVACKKRSHIVSSFIIPIIYCGTAHPS